MLLDGSVTLQCLADGNPSPQIEWWSRGQQLNNTILGISISDDGTLLTLDSVKPKSAGWYTCVATNSVDEHQLTLRLNVIGIT